MTGATAGIGLVAADQIRLAPDVRLLVGARDPSIVQSEAIPLDLASLATVRRFAALVEQRLGHRKLNGLILNAGMQASDASQFTQDGFESTFAVNHLAHYLLLRLLMPHMALGAVVVITTSNLHDPRTNPIAPPEQADAQRLSRGQVGRNASAASKSTARAYAASKLCNLLTARALATSPFAQERRLSVIAFNPGLTPGTKITRHQPRALRLCFRMLVSALKLVGRANTLKCSGGLLADLASGNLLPPPGRLYASQVKDRLTWPDPLAMASDDTLMSMLWRDSAAMVDLPSDIDPPG